MRVWKGVYCDSEHEAAVNNELNNLRLWLDTQHPEYKFDVDGPDWEEAEGEDMPEEETTDGA